MHILQNRMKVLYFPTPDKYWTLFWKATYNLQANDNHYFVKNRQFWNFNYVSEMTKLYLDCDDDTDIGSSIVGVFHRQNELVPNRRLWK